MHVLGCFELLGQAQIDHVDCFWILFSAHQEVVRLDVSMDVAFFVQLLNAIQLQRTNKRKALELAYRREKRNWDKQLLVGGDQNAHSPFDDPGGRWS